MLEINELCVGTKNRCSLLHQVSLKIRTGEIWGLTGESGAGKSTLLKSIMGILGEGCGIKSGEILVNGQDILGLKPEEHRKLCGNVLGFIPQNPMTAFDRRMTIKKQMLETLKCRRGMNRRDSLELTEAVFKEVNLKDTDRILCSYPGELSGGMLQRIAAALLIMLDPAVILADEPTAALDEENRLQLLKILKAKSDTAGILFISHDVEALKEICSNVMVMENGCITETGTMEELLESPKREWMRKFASAYHPIDGEEWKWKELT
ncbi:ABC transporter ATP-binding protein [Lachnospiraceae bacterium 54-53]